MTLLDHREPALMTEEDALSVVVSATGGAACAVHEVGPVANHLAGPLAAIRPEGHPDAPTQWLGTKRSALAVDGFITTATGVDQIECSCEGRSRHPLAFTIRNISQGAFIRAHYNGQRDHQAVEQAMSSADVDRLTYHVEPRLDALKMLVDRARAEHGGALPTVVLEAAATLVATLAGPGRWDVRTGYSDGWRWSAEWRPGVTFERADGFMKHEVVQRAVLARLLTGRF